MMFLGAFILFTASVSAADVVEELQQGNVKFSTSLYQQILKSTTGNVIFCPLSVHLVLGVAQLGAKGETAHELTKGLHLPESPEKVKEGFKGLLSKLRGNQFYSLATANKIYLKDGYTINPEFMKLSQEIFDAGLELINFTDNVKAANIINKWVESKTNEKIKGLVDPMALNALTRMVLVNALHFKGNWTFPFKVLETSKRKFFKSEKLELDVDTMHRTGTFKYVENENLDAKILQIPYEGDDITFTIAVPNKKEGLKAIESQLSEVLKPQNYSNQRISLYMPKFKIESSLQLAPALQELGIKRAFDSEKADLSGFLNNNENLLITDVIQKAFINVTETGTEAAAATAVFFGVTSVFVPSDPPLEVRVDRPFFYAISHGNLPLFLGRVEQPTL